MSACSNRESGGAKDDSPPAQPETSGPTGAGVAIAELAVADVTVDAADEPRGDNALIAGEKVRIGLRITGGQPPYRGVIRAHKIGARPGDAGVSPIDAEFRPNSQPDSQPKKPPQKQPDDQSGDADPLSDAIEVGLHTVLNRQSLSGVYQLRATVTDSAGREATATSGDMQLIGNDADVLPDADQGPHIAIFDVAGRRRRTFVRGEAVTIQIRLPGAREALIKLIDPTGAPMAETSLPMTGDGVVQFPVAIPRLAQIGAHIVAARSRAGSLDATGTLEVTGRPWAPAGKLVIDAMAVYGGRDGRAPRAVILRRGEALEIEARIGGGRQRVELSVRLSGHLGVVSEKDLGHATIERPSPMRRVFARGSWTVPTGIPVGRYQLQLQAAEGKLVSMRAREVVIR